MIRTRRHWRQRRQASIQRDDQEETKAIASRTIFLLRRFPMMGSKSVVVSAVVAMSTCLLVSGTCVAAGTPQQKCASAKMKAAGKKWSAKAKCYSKALASSGDVDTDCLQKAESKFTDAFAKADSAGGCAITGDAATVETKIDDSLNDIVGDLGCGNGRPDGDESCDDGGTAAGDGCSATCDEEPGFNCVGQPSVCSSDCGDGVVSGTEECDGANLGGETCVSQGFSAGSLSCSGSCTFDTSSCTDCGDGVVSGIEECDGVNLGGETCVSQGFSSGSLSCSGSCTFDTSSCTP
jgi:cysteine-rich repeat protein